MSKFLNVELSGGTTLQALRSSAEGAAIGAATAFVGQGFGTLTQGAVGNAGEQALVFAGQVGAHAVLGGAFSEAQGGSFGEGALAAAVSQAASPAVGMVSVGDTGVAAQESIALRVSVSAVIGGTASELGGGKFVNGAVTSAFLQLFNDEHEWVEGMRPRGCR